MDWNRKEIIVTGGTGSLGSSLVHKILKEYPEVKGIRVYSRDEAKQVEMKKKVQGQPVSFLIGDVRDRQRLLRATDGCHIVIHTAALKHVPVAEENPLEYIKTNVDGTVNVIECCLDHKVEKALFISTDKAVYPVNLYGATKMCAERAWINADLYAGGRFPLFSVCRYGNVLGSRGSVIQLFEEQARKGEPFTITDTEMTRFWLTLEQAASFVISSVSDMLGGEIFVPRIPSMKVTDLAKAIYNSIIPQTRLLGLPVVIVPEIIQTGIRPGEKLHECLITSEESLSVIKKPGKYVIRQNHKPKEGYQFTLTSRNNDWWLSQEDLKEMLYGKKGEKS